MPELFNANIIAEDVRNIYRRAAGEELVVEGLREGANIVEE